MYDKSTNYKTREIKISNRCMQKSCIIDKLIKPVLSSMLNVAFCVLIKNYSIYMSIHLYKIKDIEVICFIN